MDFGDKKIINTYIFLFNVSADLLCSQVSSEAVSSAV